MTASEKRNKEIIENFINSTTVANLEYDVIPYGCNIEIKCYDVDTLCVMETILSDLEFQMRGSLRLTYNKFIKE